MGFTRDDIAKYLGLHRRTVELLMEMAGIRREVMFLRADGKRQWEPLTRAQVKRILAVHHLRRGKTILRGLPK